MAFHICPYDLVMSSVVSSSPFTILSFLVGRAVFWTNFHPRDGRFFITGPAWSLSWRSASSACWRLCCASARWRME